MLSISEGERVVIMGTSGSGKSTVIQRFIGFVSHSRNGRMEGTVTVEPLDKSGDTVYTVTLDE